MKRNIKKTYMMYPEEAEDLMNKAKTACRSEAALIRELVKGYEPRALPTEEFYEAMSHIKTLTDSIVKLSGDAAVLNAEIARWHKFQADIERRFLTPVDGLAKWL